MEKISKEIDNFIAIYRQLVVANENYTNIEKDNELDDTSFDVLLEQFERIYNEEITPSQKELYTELVQMYEEICERVPRVGENNELVSQMLSIQKVKIAKREDLKYPNSIIKPVVDKLRQVDRSALVEAEQFSIYVAPKLDGIAVKVIFDTLTGGVRKILTRGGQDITELLKNHKDIVRLQAPQSGIIHGELLVSHENFANYNLYCEQAGKSIYKNSRNAVVGLLKEDSNFLTFVATTDGFNPLFDSHIDLVGGLSFPLWGLFTSTILNNIENLFYNFYKNTEWFAYRVDGVVFSVLIHPQRQEIVRGQYPTNFVALKFPNETKKTRVLGIDYSVKKSGNITPILIVEGVDIDGSQISRVNAYNMSYMRSMGCGVGSVVEITKSNDIIPVVVRVLSPSDDFRGCSVMQENHQQEIRKYKFINAFRSLDIQGFGEQTINVLGCEVFEYDIWKVFDTKYKSQIMKCLGGYNTKLYDNFSDVVYNMKSLSLDRVIFMMQFDNVGQVLSKRFARIITRQNNDVSGIDKNVLNRVCRGEGFVQIQNTIKVLRGLGITVTRPLSDEESDQFLTFEMTGTPPTSLCANKGEFIKLIKKVYPNSEHTSLSKNTKVLFTDNLNSTTTKMNKARKNNIQIRLYTDYKGIE